MINNQVRPLNAGSFIAIPKTDTSEALCMQMNCKDYFSELAAEMQDPSSNELKGPTNLGLSATRKSHLKNKGTYATQEWRVGCVLERMIQKEQGLLLWEGTLTTQEM